MGYGIKAFGFGPYGGVRKFGADRFGNLGTPLVKGAEWNEVSDAYADIGSKSPVHETLRVCLVTPGLEGSADVVLDQLDYTRDAQNNSVSLDGSQGHVMLRIPRLYYGYSYINNTHKWEVSSSKCGRTPNLHPAFFKAGVEVPYRYIGIYNACGYDVSAGAYIDGDGTNSWLDKINDKLGSIAGKKPISAITRAQGRVMAANVGAGWQLMDFNLYSLMKLLYVSKYADLDSQSVLGNGNTRFATWSFTNCISATGKVKSISAPGQSTSGGNSGDYVNLFGIEDPFGGIWGFIDGWNINSGVNYVCNNPANFADNAGPTSAYALYGSTNPTSGGWQNALQQNISMLPGSVGAGSTTKVTDYYNYASGWRVPFIGGPAHSGSYAGLCYLYASTDSSIAISNIGGRLCF